MSFTKTKDTHGMSRKCLVSIGTALVALLVSRVGLSQVGVKATPLIQTPKTEVSQDIRYPSAHAQITTLLLEIVPGGQTGRHMHTVPRRGIMPLTEVRSGPKCSSCLLGRRDNQGPSFRRWYIWAEDKGAFRAPKVASIQATNA